MAIHPHRRRLPRHARHLVNQMLKLRVGTRASVLQTHVRQLDSAVNLADDRDRLHPDVDRAALGVRVVVGPETRSLLRQLLESRDLRVQQQLVREIGHQILKRVLAAAVRARRVARARERAGRIVRAVRRRGGLVLRWVRGRPRWVRERVTGRTTRTVGGRTPATRTRSTPAARTRAAVSDGRATRAKKPAPERASRASRS